MNLVSAVEPSTSISGSVGQPPSARTTVKRSSARARYQPDIVQSIVDEALICHLAFVDTQGRPAMIPTVHARVGTTLYVHGSPASRALRASANGETDVCITMTLLDGLVLARSAFHHSMNYRSVVIYGTATKVTDPTEIDEAFDALVNHVVAGRSLGCRPTNDQERKATLVLSIPLAEASAKIRSGDPIDEVDDLDYPAWAGVVPLALQPSGEPIPAADLSPDAPPWPGYDLRR